MAHTNGIESHWAMLKRGYVGTYHQMSGDHLLDATQRSIYYRYMRIPISIATFFCGSGLLAWAFLIFGLPGYVDDGRWWIQILSSLDKGTAMAIAFLTIGFLLLIVTPITWFSDRWHTPVVNWWRRIRHVQLTALPVLNQPDEDLVCFTECLPHVQRSRKLIQAYTGAFGTFEIGLQVFQRGSAKFGEIATELEYLTQKFSTLGIQCPDIWGEEGNDSFDKVHSRLRAWSSHLARLEAKIHQEDIRGARFQQE